MANRTIYPYGQDGQIPSSIGIVNDLSTGGVNKALSAQMGKEIGDYVFGNKQMVDLSSITTSVRSPSLAGYWDYANKGKHKVIPCNPGDVFSIQITASQNIGGWYLWLTSSYVVPTSKILVPYCSGTDRMLFSYPGTGKSEIVTAPADAAYLCVCPNDGDGYASTWQVYKYITEAGINDDFVRQGDIVDNLNSSSITAPLSGNQGKVLASMIGGGIPEGPTKYSFEGAAFRINEHKVAQAGVATITTIQQQGGACFGDYFFSFNTGATTCWMHDLSTGELIQTISVADRGFANDCHANTVNFGLEYYDSNDPFPLIYVSTGDDTGGYSGVLVYRIVESAGVYTLTLVQTLKIPGTAWTEFVTAGSACFVYIEGAKPTYYRFPMPKLSDGDITFDISEALGSYSFTTDTYAGSAPQGRLYYNGKIYYAAGYPPQKLLFWGLDLASGMIETKIDLSTIGITIEPEATFIWRGHICLSFWNNGVIRALYFE